MITLHNTNEVDELWGHGHNQAFHVIRGIFGFCGL